MRKRFGDLYFRSCYFVGFVVVIGLMTIFVFKVLKVMVWAAD